MAFCYYGLWKRCYVPTRNFSLNAHSWMRVIMMADNTISDRETLAVTFCGSAHLGQWTIDTISRIGVSGGTRPEQTALYADLVEGGCSIKRVPTAAGIGAGSGLLAGYGARMTGSVLASARTVTGGTRRNLGTQTGSVRL